MKTISFKFQLRHTAPSGTAIVVSSYKNGLKHVTDNFEEGFKTERIGTTDKGYSIYENYQDSGSNDYIYFAVK